MFALSQKKNFSWCLVVWWVVANKFRLLLDFSWVSSDGRNMVQNLLLRGGLWLNYCCSWEVVGGGGNIMAACGWWWVVVVVEGEIKASRG